MARFMARSRDSDANQDHFAHGDVEVVILSHLGPPFFRPKAAPRREKKKMKPLLGVFPHNDVGLARGWRGVDAGLARGWRGCVPASGPLERPWSKILQPTTPTQDLTRRWPEARRIFSLFL